MMAEKIRQWWDWKKFRWNTRRAPRFLLIVEEGHALILRWDKPALTEEDRARVAEWMAVAKGGE